MHSTSHDIPTLHVVTTYFGNSPRNAVWLRLQQEFLQRTTKNYKFSVYLNNCDESLFNNVDVLGVAPKNLPQNMSQNHLLCLKELIKLVDKTNETYLILDSDCFPIRNNWQTILLNAINNTHYGGRKSPCKYEVAAPIRVENLDLFPHPCAMFITKDGMESLEMIPSSDYIYDKNLVGIKRQEPTCSLPAFPLLRSNKVNIHPLGAAIYHRIFYHHGAGSRFPVFHNDNIKSFRDGRFTCIREWKSSFDDLNTDPVAYLSKLDGSEL